MSFIEKQFSLEAVQNYKEFIHKIDNRPKHSLQLCLLSLK